MTIKKDKNKNRDAIQKKAITEWITKGKKGTVQMATGLGKTFVALHALYTMPKNTDVTHVFLAEVNDRLQDLYEQISLYKIIFKRDVLKDYKLNFICYQSAHKLFGQKYGLIIADEIHDSLTPTYSNFYYNNAYDAIIGLSANVNIKTAYILKDGSRKTKGDYLYEIAPIVFNYRMGDSISNNTSRNLNVHVIYNELDKLNKYIKAGSKNNVFLQTEYANYKYWDTRFNNCFLLPMGDKRDREFQITSNKRKHLLYNLQSKVQIVNILLNNLKSKTVLFANSLTFLEKITKNVVSSNNSDARNAQIKYWLKNNIIRVIGSFKKLKQGANLSEDLDNCIIASYYSSDVDLEQRIGRLRDNGKEGNVFIILTRYTQEEKWFQLMMKDIKKDLNIIYHDNINKCINHLTNEKINN